MSHDELYNEFGEPAFEDRSTGLLVFGSIQVLMGIGCALLTSLLLITALFNPQVGVRSMIPAVGMYGVIAIVCFVLGAGSILGRRWARALTLVLASIWLVIGIVSVVMMAFWLPAMFNPGVQGQQMPPGARTAFLAGMLGGFSLIYILLPGCFVLFYKSPHVKATCEFKDPQVRWTDQCPLPVLALSVLLAFGAVSMVMSFSYGPALPFFGVILKGWPAGLGILGVSLIFAALAWGTYKIKPGAWWGSLIMYLGFGLSNIITFTIVDTIELYKAMDFPEEQLEMMQKTGIIDRMNIPLMTSLGIVPLVIYQLWVRKYFVPPEGAQEEVTSTNPET